MLTYEEIIEALGDSIIIYPLDLDQLRGANYNLKVGRFVWLHDQRTQASEPSQSKILPMEGVQADTGIRYDIPPGSLVSVMTREVLAVDKSTTGLFHSKVDMVTKGFSHISTTLDPDWIGPLLITMYNCSPLTISLWQDETFVKVAFYRLSRPTDKGHSNYPGRPRQLAHQGFVFPDEDRDFLDLPINCDRATLKDAFQATDFYRRKLEAKASESARTGGWLQFILAGLALLAALTSFWWLPRVSGVELQDEALAAILGTSLVAFHFFTQAISDPPWRPKTGK